MLKSIFTLSVFTFLLVACNFSDGPTAHKDAPVVGKVENMTTMFAYKNYPNIKSIYLVGTFNNWDETADPFDYNAQRDIWEYDNDPEDGFETGLYDYKFLIHYKNNKDDWILDPNNPVSMKDKAGYTNSAIYIGTNNKRAKYKGEADKLFSIAIDDKKVSSVYISGNFNNWDKLKKSKYKMTLNQETGAWEINLTLDPGVYFYKYIGYRRNTNKIYEWYNDPKTAFKDLVSDDNGGFKDRIIISPWDIKPISDALIYYCNNDESISSVTLKIVDTLNHETPTELYSFYMGIDDESGCWEKKRLFLPQGRYEYKLVVATSRGDERWIHDPNSNSLQVVEDKFEEGAYNSLLTIGPAMPAEYDFSFDASSFENVVSVYLVGDFNGWEDESIDPMKYNSDTKKWELSKTLTRGKYGYKYRLQRANESTFQYPLFKNDPNSREERESDLYGYHSVLTVY